MPVGMPKVPYLVPGDDDASWIDLYNRLYQERLLFLGEEIKSETANHIVGLMVYLSMEDETRDINLFINSPGGDVMSGMAIYDGMHFVKADVQTICMGVAASMASLILLGGETTKRLAFPHARIMMHQPACSFIDYKTGEGMLDSSELLKLHDNIVEIYAQKTGRSEWQIYEDFHRDSFMSPEEAKEYGIIDEIAAPGFF